MITNPTAAELSYESDNESIATYFGDGQQIQFAKGETIIGGLTEPDGAYLIKDGFVKAYSVSPTGHTNLLVIHHCGEFVPLPWALDGRHTTSLFYEAMSDVTTLRVSKDSLRTEMCNNSWLSQEVLKQAVEMLGIYTQRIQILEYRSARERIIAELLYLAERFGKPDGKHISIDVPLTHQDIAGSINMTRETASRALEQLFQEKLIGQEDHSFIVFDLPRLNAALS